MKQYSDLDVYGKIKQEVAQGTESNDVVIYSTLSSYVTGPSTSTANHVILFNDATGKVIKDSGMTLGASIPAPTSTNAGKALIVNTSGNGYTFGEAGKVDDVKIGTTSIVSNKIATIPTATNSQLGLVKLVYTNGDSSNTVPTEAKMEAFVNSSIATNTANFLGTYDAEADLGLSESATHEQVVTALNGRTWTTAPTNNDYVFVQFDLSTDPGNIDRYDRYKYNGTTWEYEYTLNNSSFTEAQWSAINSGITNGKVTSYDNHVADSTIHVTQADKNTWNGKQDAISLTANRAVISSSSGTLTVSATTNTELGYVHGVTSAIQTQLDGKISGISSSTANHIVTFNGTDGKTIKDSGYTIATSVPSGAVFTDQKVKQNLKATSDTGTYPVLMKNSTTKTDSPTGEANYVAGVYIQPSTGTITATTFAGNASTATEFSATTTVALTGDATGTSSASKKGWSVPVTLANSGVTAGSYGDSGTTRTLAYSGTFSVPYVTVDAKGRVTGASTLTFTLPSSDNTDAKTSSSNSASKLFLVGATTQSTSGQTTYSNSAVYTQSGTLYATTFSGGLAYSNITSNPFAVEDVSITEVA